MLIYFHNSGPLRNDVDLNGIVEKTNSSDFDIIVLIETVRFFNIDHVLRKELKNYNFLKSTNNSVLVLLKKSLAVSDIKVYGDILSFEITHQNIKYFVTAFYALVVNEHRKIESEEYFLNLLESFKENHIVNRPQGEIDLLIGDLNFPLFYDDGVISGRVKSAHKHWTKKCFGELRHFLIERNLLQLNTIPNGFRNFIDVCFTNKQSIKVKQITNIGEQLFPIAERAHHIYSYEL